MRKRRLVFPSRAAPSSVNYYLNAATASIQSPLADGSNWVAAPDSTDWPTQMQIATGAVGGVKAIVGNNGSSSFSDTVSILSGAYLGNQTVTVTIYNSGLTLGSGELEVHLCSRGNSTQHFMYEFDITALNGVQLAKWVGARGSIGVLVPLVAFPVQPLPDLSQLICSVTGNGAPLRTLTCVYRPAGTSGASDVTVFSFTDDGTNTGTNGGSPNSAANWSNFGANNIAAYTTGNPGCGSDNTGIAGGNASDLTLNQGYRDFRAVTTPLG